MRFALKIWTREPGTDDCELTCPLPRTDAEDQALTIARELLRSEPLCSAVALVEVDEGNAPVRVVWDSRDERLGTGERQVVQLAIRVWRTTSPLQPIEPLTFPLPEGEDEKGAVAKARAVLGVGEAVAAEVVRIDAFGQPVRTLWDSRAPATRRAHRIRAS